MSCVGVMTGCPDAGREQVVGRKHEDAAFELRLERQRHVHGHLVAVKVGVERRADQRMEPDRFAFDKHREKRLNAETVQRRRAVQEHRVVLDDLFEDVPYLGTLLFHEFFRAILTVWT